MSFSNHLENIVLDCIFGKIWYTPMELWLGLSKTDPGEDGWGLREPWWTGESSTAPEGGGWLWLRGGSWDYVPEGYPAEPYGGWLYRKMFPEDTEPDEAGGFPDLPAGSQLQLLTSGVKYARIKTQPSDWLLASEGVVANDNPITFEPAATDWGEITHFALFDAWWLILSGTLSPSKTINAGHSPQFDRLQLEIFLS